MEKYFQMRVNNPDMYQRLEKLAYAWQSPNVKIKPEDMKDFFDDQAYDNLPTISNAVLLRGGDKNTERATNKSICAFDAIACSYDFTEHIYKEKDSMIIKDMRIYIPESFDIVALPVFLLGSDWRTDIEKEILLIDGRLIRDQAYDSSLLNLHILIPILIKKEQRIFKVG